MREWLGVYSLRGLCCALQVSPSGYYAWRRRPAQSKLLCPHPQRVKSESASTAKPAARSANDGKVTPLRTAAAKKAPDKAQAAVKPKVRRKAGRSVRVHPTRGWRSRAVLLSTGLPFQVRLAHQPVTRMNRHRGLDQVVGVVEVTPHHLERRGVGLGIEHGFQLCGKCYRLDGLLHLGDAPAVMAFDQRADQRFGRTLQQLGNVGISRGHIHTCHADGVTGVVVHAQAQHVDAYPAAAGETAYLCR